MSIRKGFNKLLDMPLLEQVGMLGTPASVGVLTGTFGLAATRAVGIENGFPILMPLSLVLMGALYTYKLHQLGAQPAPEAAGP